MNIKLPPPKIRNYIIILAVTFFIFSIVAIFLLKNNSIESQVNKVSIRKHIFLIDIAQTKTEQSKGLMGVELMDVNQGMLFIYEKEDYRTFWMKDTLIPLDIIFIDDNNKIVEIMHNVKPCDTEECTKYRGSKKSKYVLEINGGLSEKYNFAMGDPVKMLSNYK